MTVGFSEYFMYISAREKAKARGRRRSIELEDLDMNPTTGSLKLPPGFKKAKDITRTDSKDAIAEEPESPTETQKVPSIRRPRKTISEQQHDFVVHRQKSKTSMGTKEKQIVNSKLDTAQKAPLKRVDSDQTVKKRVGSVKGVKSTRDKKSPDRIVKSTSVTK